MTVSKYIATKLQLKYEEDIRTIAFTLTYFILFAYLWFNTRFILSDGWLSTKVLLHLPVWLSLCYFSFLGAVATHNVIHCPMFQSRILNRIFQITLSLVYGHPVTSYVPGHNLSHHKYTQQRKDVMRTTKLQYKWHLLNGLLFFVKIGVDMIGNDARYFAIQRKLNRPIIKQLKIEQYILWSITAILAIWDWKAWFVIAFLPHLYAKFCIISLNLLQHDGCDPESRYNFSRNFTGKWLNFFCYNNGYHTIHHLHPSVTQRGISGCRMMTSAIRCQICHSSHLFSVLSFLISGLHWSLLPDRHEKELIPYIAPALDQPYILTYIWRTFVYPGIRIDWEGNPWTPPPLEPDVPWFYEQTETYSTGETN